VDAAAEALESGIATEIGMDGVAGDREAGTANIPLAKVGQQLLVPAAQAGVFERDLSSGGSGKPDAEKPQPVEAGGGEPIKLRIATSSSVAGRPNWRERSVSRTRVLIW